METDRMKKMTEITTQLKGYFETLTSTDNPPVIDIESIGTPSELSEELCTEISKLMVDAGTTEATAIEALKQSDLAVGAYNTLVAATQGRDELFATTGIGALLDA